MWKIFFYILNTFENVHLKCTPGLPLYRFSEYAIVHLGTNDNRPTPQYSSLRNWHLNSSLCSLQVVLNCKTTVGLMSAAAAVMSVGPTTETLNLQVLENRKCRTNLRQGWKMEDQFACIWCISQPWICSVIFQVLHFQTPPSVQLARLVSAVLQLRMSLTYTADSISDATI